MRTDFEGAFRCTRRHLLKQGSGVAAMSVGLSAGLLAACAPMSTSTRQSSAHESGAGGPLGYRTSLVNVSEARFRDRDALMVELTAAAQQAALAGTGTGTGTSNRPSFAMPAAELANGVIEVELAARINGKGGSDARGFVGIAFHIDDNSESFEAVYLRMTNGSKNSTPPPAPRNVYAIQYIGIPGRYWRKLRQEHPNKYEKAAPVAIETWHTLRLEIQGSEMNAFVDGEKVLTVADLSFPNRKGRIGLWVDDGTAGYFRNLKVAATS